MNTSSQTSWYAPLLNFRSLGSQHKGPGSLAGLHEARAEHMGQFFTPSNVALFMWRIVSPAIEQALRRSEGTRVSLFDNSVGAGRLFQFADPVKHTLAGVDLHAPSINALSEAAKTAGFVTDFIVAGMEEVRPRGFGVALINPPFSIHLESPHLAPWECCSFGKFGPGTSCQSHVYAVAQALHAADIVAAVLPLTFAETLATDPFFSRRLRYIAKLPAGTFKGEGAVVSTAIAVWDSFDCSDTVIRENLQTLDGAEIPALDLTCCNIDRREARPLVRAGLENDGPAIKTPVTGIGEVRVVRHNRRVILKFRCGLVEAKVLNAVFEKRLDGFEEEHRYPKGVDFKGQGLLDLQIHLLQADPVASFKNLEAKIRTAGGLPVIDPGIYGYLRRMGRKVSRHQTPLGHTIFSQGLNAASSEVDLIADQTFLLDPKKWGSPVVKKGTTVKGRRTAAGFWTFSVAGKEWTFSEEQLKGKLSAGARPPEWVVKFPGRLVAEPALAHQAKKKAASLGIDRWLTWDGKPHGYQLDDACELALSPFSAAIGWEMGLGKSRLSFALCLLKGSKHNLIVTEAHLVPELVAELKAINLAPELWQAIESAEDLTSLRTINVISYNRLRQAVNPGCRKYTYAKALRRRIGTMICDEGHVLRNLTSDQTQAVWCVSAMRRYIFTGTLIASYPRDTLAMLAWVGGSATAIQPYGIRGQLFLEPRLISSMSKAQRGVDAYRDDFVTLEWVTHEFREDMQEGAKREVPKIANLPKYRDWLCRLVKRRVAAEPEVSKYIKIPVPTEEVKETEWDQGHLEYYLKVADEFAAWYRKAKQSADCTGVNLNLIALLARIGAVEKACNYPQSGIEGFGAYYRLPSKQRYAVERAVELSEQGHKTIIYAKSPALLETLARELSARGVESVVLHGGRDIVSRTEELRKRFRWGSAPVLLASLGCTQTGLNIPEADRVLFIGRDWTAKTERQALARTLRPQQKRDVLAEYIHLPGSIDCYQAQLVRWKGDAADAGLDWATPITEGEKFQHLDHILASFVSELEKLQAYATHRDQEPIAV